MKKFIKYLSITILIIFISIIGFIYLYVLRVPSIDIKKLELEDLSGNTVRSSSFLDLKKPTVLNFWATWCGPCVAEFKYFNTVKEQKKDSIQFIVISDQPLEKINAFVEKNKYPFIFLKSKKPIQKIFNKSITSLPVTYFIDKSGEIISTDAGAPDKESEFIEEIDDFFQEIKE